MIDAADRRILTALQQDGRISNQDLAARIHLSPAACHRRVKRLEQEGVIEGYASIVNQAAIGLAESVFAEVALQTQADAALDAFEKAVRETPEIIECYLMTGDYGYLLRVAVSGVSDFEAFHRRKLSGFPYVARIRTSFTLRSVCRRAYPVTADGVIAGGA